VKFILTVIAVCLVYLCFDRPSLIESVEAQQPSRVVIVGFESGGDVTSLRLPMPVRIVSEK
jgi:hypothetical protein